MNAKTTIRKILFITIWIAIGGGMLTLLLAAISSKKKGQCADVTITLKGAKNNLFVSEAEVEEVLLKANNGAIRGKPVESFKLHELEQTLKQNQWVSDAELFFDNNNNLEVVITQKEPVARIFTAGNSSFYIDSNGYRMPLSERLSARVPVFTGFPEKKILGTKDSLLLQEIKMIANYINRQPFWLAQVAQLEIGRDKKFEMIPVVGNHIVRLGAADNIDAKFNRLMTFYKMVLSKTGFDKYKLIDVQYKGQVVASRFAGDPKVDSVQLKKNVDKLLRYSMEASNDTVIRVAPVIKLEKDVMTSVPQSQELPGEKSNEVIRTDEKKKRTKPVKKTAEKSVKQVPKAVMPAKPVKEENDGYY